MTQHEDISGAVEPSSYNKLDARLNWVETLTITGVYAAINEIAGTIAELPKRTYRRRKDGGRDYFNHRILKLFDGNDAMSGYDLVETAMLHMALFGDSFMEIEQDMVGNPIGLWPIQPGTIIKVAVGPDQRKYFETNEGERYYEDTVLHIHGPSFTGLKGINVVDLFGRALGIQVEVERYSAKFFKHGRPSGVLELSDRAADTPKNLAAIRKAFADAALAEEAQNVAVLPNGTKYTSISGIPDEAQFNNTRQAVLLDIARIFRIPPSRIGYEQQSTYNNREADALRFAKDCITPIARRIENAFKRRFLGDNEHLQIDVTELTEPSFAQKVAVLEKLAGGNRQILTVNEIRELMGYEPNDELAQQDATRATEADAAQGEGISDNTDNRTGEDGRGTDNGGGNSEEGADGGQEV